MTIMRWSCLNVWLLTQTPTKYIFSESLGIVDYGDIFILCKNINVIQKERVISKSTEAHKSGSFPDKFEWGKTISIAMCSSHISLRNCVGEYWLLVWFVFDTQINFKSVRNNYCLRLNSHNFWKKKKVKIPRHSFVAQLSGNMLSKFQRKLLKPHWKRT